MKLLTVLTIILLILFSQSAQTQWTNPDLTLTGRQIQCFTVMDTVILAGTSGGLVRSTDNAGSWSNYGGIMGSKNIHSLVSVTSYPFNVLGGTINYGSGGIFQSTNNGESWSGFPTDLTQPPNLAHVNSILKIETSSYFWVGTDLGVYLLTQYYPLGTWIPYSSGLASGAYTKVRDMVSALGEIFAGTDNGVYILNGSAWVPMNNGLTNTNVTALRSTGGYLFAGTSHGSTDGVFVSADTGKTWTLSKTIPVVTSMLTIGSNIFVGSYGDGVWLTKNDGASWNQVNDGLSSNAYYVLSLASNGQFLFDGTGSASVWRRPLSQMITLPAAVHETYLQPKIFSLEQNYPNPFNPSTTIQFSLAKTGFTTLKIFTLLGMEVATLYSENLDAGIHTKDWSAAGLSSGIYFYRLRAGSFVETKKLIVMK
jgi:hypothetical protein